MSRWKRPPGLSRVTIRRRLSRRCISQGSLCAHGRCEQPTRSLQIVRGIHADRVLAGLNHSDGKAVFEHAQLFERLAPLQGRARERGHLKQELTPVDIQADMLERSCTRVLGTAREWNARAREIQGKAAAIRDYFHHVGV